MQPKNFRFIREDQAGALGRLCQATFEAAKREGFTELEATRAAAFVVVGIFNPRRPWAPARAALCALEARELAADEGATVAEQWSAFVEAVAREPDAPPVPDLAPSESWWRRLWRRLWRRPR